MKSKTRQWIAVLVAAVVLTATPAGAAPYYFWWQAVDEYGQPYTGQNVQCSVFRPNIHGAAVLHADAALGYLGTSPIFSDTNGRLHFWSTSSDPVDATCFYAYGAGQFSGRMRTTDHKIILPRSGLSIARFAVNSATATYQTDSGIIMPQGALIEDVIIQNLAPAAVGTYHLSVGFLGNHAAANAIALVNTQALNSPDEWLRPHFTSTVPGTGTNVANHRGTALQFHVAGISYPVERRYLVHVATGLQVSYSAQPGTTAGVRAHVFILFQKLHAPANALPFGVGR